MRIYASKTGARAAVAVAFCAASCAAPRKATPPPHGPPPASVLVRDEHVSFRLGLWLELHAALAAAARNQTEGLPPAMSEARGSYARVLADDDDDRLFTGAARAVAGCESAACASAALGPFRGAAFRALPAFDWEARASIAWTAIERARSAFGPQADGILVALAKDLGVTPGPVDIVAESPPAGSHGLLAPLLAARSPCFVDTTRIVDCVAVRALLSGTRPAGFSDRFFTVLVVHAVAATVAGFDPKHVSVDRRAVAVAEPDLLAFVTREWHGGPVTPELEARAPSAPASR